MLHYQLSPSLVYQDKPWHQFGRRPARKSFRAVSWVVLYWVSVYQRMLSRRQPVTVFYCTETGTARRLAATAAAALQTTFRCSLETLADPGIVASKAAASQLCLFIVSTTGNGEAPGAARMLAAELEERRAGQAEQSCSLDPSLQPSLQHYWAQKKLFAVFGLGNSSYPRYAQFGRRLDRALYELGGERLLELVCGDELADQRAVFTAWLQQLALLACHRLAVPASPARLAETLGMAGQSGLVAEYRLVDCGKVGLPAALAAAHGAPATRLELLARQELHSDPCVQPTLLVSMAGPGLELAQPGDHIAICPPNRQAEVELLQARLVWPAHLPAADTPVRLEQLAGSSGPWLQVPGFPAGLTTAQLLHNWLDIRSVPSQPVLGLLAEGADLPGERAELAGLAGEPGRYAAWRAAGRGLLATLAQFPSVRVSGVRLLAALPALQPRRYSLASLARGDQADLLLSVVEDGLASGHLARADLGAGLTGWLRPEPGFRPPVRPATPLLLVAAGSGLAPFRGFWQQRAGQAGPGRVVLYYGCRHAGLDLLAEETAGLLTRRLALSRQPDWRGPRYVQELLWQQRHEVAELLSQQAAVYVCGKIKMAEAVLETIKRILKDSLDLDDEETEKRIQNMKNKNLYNEDIFG